MAGIGTGYDLSVSTISPDGRVFQVEYAAKAVDQSPTTVGLLCKDGIIFAAQKVPLSVCALKETGRRIFAVDFHCTIAVAGFVADAMQIVNRARSEAKEYRRVYGAPIPGKVLAERVAYFVHAYTLAGSERPFGASVLLGVHSTNELPTNVQFGMNNESGDMDESMDAEKSVLSVGPTNLQLYTIENSGVCYRYFGAVLGSEKQPIKSAIERIALKEITVREAAVQLFKVIHKAKDETVRENGLTIDMAWICEESNWKHDLISSDVLEVAKAEALRQIEIEEDAELIEAPAS